MTNKAAMHFTAPAAMTLAGLLKRFTIAYLIFLLGGTLLVFIIGADKIMVIGFAALLAAVIHAGLMYRQRNGGKLSKSVFWRAYGGMMTIDLLVQAVAQALPLATGKVSVTFSFAMASLMATMVFHVFIALIGLAIANKITPPAPR